VLLTEACCRCMTPASRPRSSARGANMRTLQRLIEGHPLAIDRPAFSFYDNGAALRRAPPGLGGSYVCSTRSKQHDEHRGDPVAKTYYRKLPRDNVWHFCTNCENWPQSRYEQRDNSDPPNSFCADCIQKHRDGKCEWLNEEAVPPKKSR
jgi:hypothetical protein